MDVLQVFRGKGYMEENVVNNPEQTDVLASWKQTSAFILSAAVAFLGYCAGIGVFYSLLLFLPVMGLLHGFFDNKSRNFWGNLLFLLLFPILTGSRSALEASIVAGVPESMGPWTRHNVFIILQMIICCLLSGQWHV